VVLVWLVWFVSKRFVNEIIKWLDYQSSISKSLIIKGIDNQDYLSVWLSKDLIIKTKNPIIKSMSTHKKVWYVSLIPGGPTLLSICEGSSSSPRYHSRVSGHEQKGLCSPWPDLHRVKLTRPPVYVFKPFVYYETIKWKLYRFPVWQIETRSVQSVSDSY
jgi:hypothetical protein